MKDYLVTYYSPASAMEKMATATPEEKMAGMKPWMDWQSKMGESLKNMGAPLKAGAKIHSGGKIEDGGSAITGYSIIQANNLDEAKDLLKDHPHLQWDPACKLEVHESIPMG